MGTCWTTYFSIHCNYPSPKHPPVSPRYHHNLLLSSKLQTHPITISLALSCCCQSCPQPLKLIRISYCFPDKTKPWGLWMLFLVCLQFYISSWLNQWALSFLAESTSSEEPNPLVPWSFPLCSHCSFIGWLLLTLHFQKQTYHKNQAATQSFALTFKCKSASTGPASLLGPLHSSYCDL